MYKRLVVVIPTRNRSDLAIRAANSAFSSADRDDVSVLISDNSTEPAHSAALDSFIASMRAKDLYLVRPCMPLSMTAHWEFAINKALLKSEFSHFVFLTDRMIFKRESLGVLVAIAKQYPLEILSYSNDQIDDFPPNIRFFPALRSGRLFRIDSSSLIAQSAKMSFNTCLPRMLNCVAPREHLVLLNERYNSVFSSTSPDFCFCYRTLASTEAILYLDESLMVSYALDRSNGASVARGLPSKDSVDFRMQLTATELNGYAPLPEIITVGNAVIHEYFFVKNESANPKFLPIARGPYLDYLAHEAFQFKDRNLKSDSLAILRSSGWRFTFSFGWYRFNRALMGVVALLLAKKFTSVEGALEFSCTRSKPRILWIHSLTRRYAHEQVPISVESLRSKNRPG
jgi:hypothetical protein